MAQEIKRVLVIDDTESIRSMVTTLLAHKGVTVVEAHDGQEGIEIFEKDSDFDLIITDHEMPRKNGMHVVEEIRQKMPAMRIWVYSGRAVENWELTPHFIALGAERVIYKPDIIQVIRSHWHSD